MAEFPHLGKHCSFEACNMLDFLPIKCFGCQKDFCAEHFRSDVHECDQGLRDVRVPVCPLCDKPVPVAKSENVNVVVSAHIDNDCLADPARQKRAYRNVIPFTCRDCGLNYCVRHRHSADHDCKTVGKGSRKLPEQLINSRFPAESTNSYNIDRLLAEQLQRQEDGQGPDALNDTSRRCVIS